MAGKDYAVTHSDAEWRQILTLEQYDVMRAHGTEAPGSCALLLEKRPGRFSCTACGQPLFESKTKFESGTGWPSFNDPIEGAIETSIDRTLGMSEPRFIARPAAAILGTSLTMARHRTICATALTGSR
jgi:peptide-methionine (R)-S-oxide reductase